MEPALEIVLLIKANVFVCVSSTELSISNRQILTGSLHGRGGAAAFSSPSLTKSDSLKDKFSHNT